ncbi:hypothetical protein BegalDRAFT_0196 [Beggiatoa alba B18LD]|uniref:Uncharacterized protein n=1 Tax=Beggiatoa alba B18LD TaxID=395493 RepID=I3CBX6_9GAMM|nr:hypothetical protein [Beggiatoa alba]EIJ41119.1 hypothetical protein BegalDRAFT_0196 [Beggiatoa alba B18LD]
MTSTETTNTERFDPQVHIHIKLSYQERLALKELATAQGISVETLLQQQIKQLITPKNPAI